jgi:Fe-S cluster biogenesis protein NfuA
MMHEEQVAIIKHVLSELQPMIIRDGGTIEFVKLENNVVYVQLQGACVSCPSSIFTLKFGLQQALQAHLPHIEDVVAVD